MKKSSNKATIVPRILPRGRHKLGPELVAASQRQRLLESMTSLVAEKGYAAVTISEVAIRAGTAKRTFYDHFADKLHCFLCALDVITDALVASGARFFSVSGSVRDRCECSIRGYLELLVSMPNTAKVFYLEAIAAGPEAVTRRNDVQLKFARHIVEMSRRALASGEGRELSELHALGVVGAMHQLIYAHLHKYGPENLLEICDDVVPLVVAFLTVRMPPPRKPSKAPTTAKLDRPRKVRPTDRMTRRDVR